MILPDKYYGQLIKKILEFLEQIFIIFGA